MAALLARGVREIFRRELIPVRLRWWFVAEGMLEWYRVLAEGLGAHLSRPRQVIAELAVPMFTRRHRILRERHDVGEHLGILFGGLHRIASAPEMAWVFEPLGGAPRTFAQHREAERRMRGLSMEARWRELTTHLGELLIALTDGLPRHMERARPILGDMCFAAGVKYGKKMKRALALEGEEPALAIEVLRHSEYIFDVNPDHWGGSDKSTGWLEGDACPWYTAPGWNGAHCGIFGQFQSGISSVFGLRYHLAKTIPKHGGSTCRVDLKPIPLRLHK